jgi:hypothetical protein
MIRKKPAMSKHLDFSFEGDENWDHWTSYIVGRGSTGGNYIQIYEDHCKTIQGANTSSEMSRGYHEGKMSCPLKSRSSSKE